MVSLIQINFSDYDICLLLGSCSLPFFKVSSFVSTAENICSDEPPCDLLTNQKDYSGVLNFKSPMCQFRTISRKDDYKLSYSSWSVPDANFRWSENDTLEVRCPGDFVFYKYCLYRKIERNFKLVNSKRVSSKNKPKFPMNIIAVGLDSMSRFTYHQQLSKSLHFFAENMQSIEFNGQTIVGDGTTAAFMAMLGGFFEEEIHESRRGFENAKSLDDIGFIWKDFHNAGYITQHDETDPEYGTFNLRLLGFEKPPVDYYGRPYQLASESTSYDKHCMGTKTRFREGLENILNLFKAYSNDGDPLKFALHFDGLLTHTEFPRGELLDNDLLYFLQQVSSNPAISNSTMVIVFSDHGPRYGQSRQTLHGKYEERSPFFAISLPQWFRREHPDVVANLQWNANFTLTTPFDVYATFLDILGIQNPNQRHGVSLFSRLPSDRNCDEASVAAHWCPCGNGLPVDLNSELVQDAMSVFISLVNNDWLKPTNGICLPLQKAEPVVANIITPSTKMANFKQTVDGHGRVASFDNSEDQTRFLVISFKTEPGNGTWEATYEIHKGNKPVLKRSQVSRTNAYGHAADCVSNTFPHLRQYCFCKFSNVT